MVNQRSPGRQHAASKARILGAALQLLTANGLTNWSISECAETAKCAKGLVLHYFGSKESLLGAVAAALISRRVTEWRASLSGEGVTALDALWLALVAEAEGGRARAILELRFAGIPGAALDAAQVGTLRAALARALGTDATELPASSALGGILEGYQLAVMGNDGTEETREAFYRYWLTYVP